MTAAGLIAIVVLAVSGSVTGLAGWGLAHPENGVVLRSVSRLFVALAAAAALTIIYLVVLAVTA